MTIRLRYRIVGAHVHCRLFTSRSGTFAKSGDLVFGVDQWDLVWAALAKAGIELVPE